jgi:hypothetical protein
LLFSNVDLLSNIFHGVAVPIVLSMTQQDWQELTEEVFGRVFRRSAVKRARYVGLRRNIGFLREGLDYLP